MNALEVVPDPASGVMELTLLSWKSVVKIIQSVTIRLHVCACVMFAESRLEV